VYVAWPGIYDNVNVTSKDRERFPVRGCVDKHVRKRVGVFAAGYDANREMITSSFVGRIDVDSPDDQFRVFIGST